jgi:hypothetical protein
MTLNALHGLKRNELSSFHHLLMTSDKYANTHQILTIFEMKIETKHVFNITRMLTSLQLY